MISNDIKKNDIENKNLDNENNEKEPVENENNIKLNENKIENEEIHIVNEMNEKHLNEKKNILQYPSLKEIQNNIIDNDEKIKNEKMNKENKLEKINNALILNSLKEKISADVIKEEERKAEHLLRIQEEIRKSKKIKEDWKIRKNSMYGQETIMLLILLICIIIFFMSLFNVSDCSDVVKSFTNKFGFAARTKTNVDHFTIDNLFDMILDGADNSYFFANGKYGLISSIRVTTRRFKKFNLPKNRYIRNYTGVILETWDKKYGNLHYSDPDWEEVDDVYSCDSNLSNSEYTFAYNLNDSFLGHGGYVYNVSIAETVIPTINKFVYKTNQAQKEIANERFDCFMINTKIDVSRLYIDFIFINYEMQMIVPIYVVFETTHSNKYYAQFSNFCIPIGSRRSLMYLVISIITAVVILLILFLFLRNTLIKVSHQEEKYRNQLITNLKQEKWQKMKENKTSDEKFKIFYDVPISETEMIEEVETKIPNKRSIYSKVMFTSINIIYLINIICFFIFLVLTLLSYLNLLKTLTDINLLNGSDKLNYLDLKFQNNFFRQCFTYTNNYLILPINFLFICFKLLEVVNHYFKSANVIVKTIVFAIEEIISMVVLIIILLITMDLFYSITFSGVIDKPDDFYYNFFQSFWFFSLNIDKTTFDKMYRESPTISFLFFFVNIFIIKFTYKTIIQGITLYNFRVSELDTERIEDSKKIKIHTKKVVGKTDLMKWILFYKKLATVFLDVLLCKCKKKSPNINHSTESKVINDDTKKSKSKVSGYKKLDDQDNLEEAILSKDVNMFNVQNNQDFIASIRDPYFEAEKDDYKLKSYYESYYKQTAGRSYFYFAYLFTLFIMNLMNNFISENYKFKSSLLTLLTDTNANGFTKSQQIQNLYSIESIRNYTFKTTPNLFYARYNDSSAVDRTRNYTNYMMRYSALVKNSMMITIKKFNFKYDDQSLIRESGDRSISTSDINENMTDIVVSNRTYKYTIDNSYNNYGGYAFIINPMPALRNFTQQEINSLIDEYTTSVVIEVVTENTEYPLFDYFAIVMTLSTGGKFNIDIDVDNIPYQYWRNSMFDDVLQLIGFVFFIFFTFYYIVKCVIGIKRRADEYDCWCNSVVKKLKVNTQMLRAYNENEIYRKITYIIDSEVIFQVLIFIVACLLIYSKLMIINNQLDLSSLHQLILQNPDKYTIYDIRKYIYSIRNLSQFFKFVANSGLILNTFYNAILLNLSKIFKVMISTLNTSFTSGLGWLLVILSIQPVFLFYQYFIFGANLDEYGSLYNSFTMQMYVIKGPVDFKTIYNSFDSHECLILIVYIFIMRFIMLDIFLGIVYSVYLQISEKVKNVIEKWSIARVYLFCWFREHEYIIIARKNRLNTEFNTSEIGPIKIYSSNMAINLRLNTNDWCTRVSDGLMTINWKLLRSQTSVQELKLALINDKLIELAIFKDNKYSGISQKHINCINLIHIYRLLVINEVIHDDILFVESNHLHLKKFKKMNEINKKFKLHKEINEVNIENVARLEKKLVKLTKEIKDLQLIQDKIEVDLNLTKPK